jgi:hypothetical protein
MGGSAEPEPGLLNLRGPEPIGPIEVYPYGKTKLIFFEQTHEIGLSLI